MTPILVNSRADPNVASLGLFPMISCSLQSFGNNEIFRLFGGLRGISIC
jgi:hypothetical protein